MQAMPRYGVPMRPQILIGAGCSVAADDIDLGVRPPQRNHQIAEEVQKAGIIFMDLPCSMVAQVLIDSGLSAGIVTVPMAVHHVESFSCVGMIEAQTITKPIGRTRICLLYTSDAADERSSV